MPRALPHPTLLALALWSCAAAPAARAHLPHDVIADVAAAVDDDGATRMVAQYAFPRRPLLLVSEDGGRSWAYRAPAAVPRELTALRPTPGGGWVAADGVAPHALLGEDGGHRWVESAPPDGTPVTAVDACADAADTPWLWALTRGGLWRSDDGGAGWTELAPGVAGDAPRALDASPACGAEPWLALLDEDAGLIVIEGDLAVDVAPLADEGEPVALAIAPGDGARLWVGTDGGAVVRSDDRGRSWAPAVALSVDGGPPLAGPVADLVVLDVERLRAITPDHAALCSDDAGGSWGACDVGLPATSAGQAASWGHYRRIEPVAGDGEALVLASFEGLMLSGDGGATWRERCTVLPPYARALAISPGYPDDPSIWIGSYGAGLYHSADGGVRWTARATDADAVFHEDIAVAPAFPDDPVILSIVNRLLLRADDAETFTEVPVEGIAALHQLVLSPAFADDGVAYALGTGASSDRWALARSDDAGERWTEVWAGAAPPAPQLIRLAASPWLADDGVLYALQSSPPAVVRSDDGGAGWETLIELPAGERPAALFAIPDDEGARLTAVARSGRAWRGGDDPAAWSEGEPVGAEVLWGDEVGVAPRDDGAREPGALFLLTDPPGLLRSLDGGASWHPLDAPSSAPVLAVDGPPAYPDDPTLLAATHHGTLFRCADDGPWQLLDRLARLEDDACPLRYAGDGWSREAGGSGGGSTRSSRAGDELTLAFDGRAVRWLASPSSHGGRARVWLDGAEVDEVTLADDPNRGDVVFEHAWDDDGPHELRVEVLGGGVVEVDAIEIERHRVVNGPHETFEAAPWCIDLPDPPAAEPPADDEPGGCDCTQSRQPRGGPPLVLLLSALLVARRRRAGQRSSSDDSQRM